MDIPVTVVVAEGPTTSDKMANWVHFVWHINHLSPGLIGRPLDGGLWSVITADGVEYEEEYAEVRVTIRKTPGTVAFTAKTDKAGQILLLAFDTWKGDK